MLFPSFPSVAYTNRDLPNPAAVQGVTDADGDAGHSLASLQALIFAARFMHGEAADPE